MDIFTTTSRKALPYEITRVSTQWCDMHGETSASLLPQLELSLLSTHAQTVFPTAQHL